MELPSLSGLSINFIGGFWLAGPLELLSYPKTENVKSWAPC